MLAILGVQLLPLLGIVDVNLGALVSLEMKAGWSWVFPQHAYLVFPCCGLPERAVVVEDMLVSSSP